MNYRVSATEHPVEMESVELLDVYLRASTDVVNQPRPVGLVVVVQFAPRRHALHPVHRSCVIRYDDLNTKLKVFRSTTPPVKLRVKLFQTLIVPTVLHGCECWTLSHTVCHKLNVFQSRCLQTILGVRWQEHVSNDTVRSRCEVTTSLAQLVRLRRLGWTGHVLRHNDLIVHDVLFSRADYRGRGRHRALVADVTGDVCLVCNLIRQ